MRYNVVAGEELKKKMIGVLDNPIPFNEDMSKGEYTNKPFTEAFIKERSIVHGVAVSLYKEKLAMFLKMIQEINMDDEIHLYFGEDETCISNRDLLIEYFKDKTEYIYVHVVDEYKGIELRQYRINY